MRTRYRILPSEITRPELFTNRRRVLAMLGSAALGGAIAKPAAAAALPPASAGPLLAAPTSTITRNAALSVKDPPNSFEDITGYNNYYEFGTDKSDPKANAQSFRPRPWTVQVAGLRKSRAALRLMTSSSPTPSKSGFIACAVLRHGRWSSPGWACHSPTC